MSHSLPRHTWPNNSALPPFQKDVTTRQALQLFSWIFRLKWQKEWRHIAARSYKREGTLSPPPTGDRPLLPLGWATGACRPLGGRQAPPFFYSRDFVANLKKKYIWALSPPHRATGVYFWNFPKRTYIFEILIFFKYKKEKTARSKWIDSHLNIFSLAINNNEEQQFWMWLSNYVI